MNAQRFQNFSDLARYLGESEFCAKGRISAKEVKNWMDSMRTLIVHRPQDLTELQCALEKAALELGRLIKQVGDGEAQSDSAPESADVVQRFFNRFVPVEKMLLSTEDDLHFLVLEHLLSIEEQAYHYFVAEGRQEFPSWPPPIKRYKRKRLVRALRSTMGFFRPFVDPWMIQEVFEGKELYPGICAAIKFEIASGAIHRPMLEPKVPLMRDFSENYAALDRAVEFNKDRCRLGNFEKYWAKVPGLPFNSAGLMDGAPKFGGDNREPASDTDRNKTYPPFLVRSMGMILLTIGPDPFPQIK